MFPAILQRHLKVLAPVEQGLRHRETLVELPDRSGADALHIRSTSDQAPSQILPLATKSLRWSVA
jgi:hypothetical protein